MSGDGARGRVRDEDWVWCGVVCPVRMGIFSFIIPWFIAYFASGEYDTALMLVKGTGLA